MPVPTNVLVKKRAVVVGAVAIGVCIFLFQPFESHKASPTSQSRASISPFKAAGAEMEEVVELRRRQEALLTQLDQKERERQDLEKQVKEYKEAAAINTAAAIKKAASAATATSTPPPPPPPSMTADALEKECPVLLHEDYEELAGPTFPPKDENFASAAAEACQAGRMPECSDMGATYNITHRADHWKEDRMLLSFIGKLTGAYVFDIGGNTGRDSEVYMNNGAEKSFIFEPIPENVETLERVFSLENGYDGTVSVLPYGLGKSDRDSRVAFHTGGGFSNGEDATEVGPDFNVTDEFKMEVIKIRDIIPFLRQFVPKEKRVFLSMNCEGCEFEVTKRLSEYDGGAYMRNGTIAQINLSFHKGEKGIDVSPGSEKALDFCGALPFLHMYYRNTYCDGMTATFPTPTCRHTRVTPRLTHVFLLSFSQALRWAFYIEGCPRSTSTRKTVRWHLISTTKMVFFQNHWRYGRRNKPS